MVIRMSILVYSCYYDLYRKYHIAAFIAVTLSWRDAKGMTACFLTALFAATITASHTLEYSLRLEGLIEFAGKNPS